MCKWVELGEEPKTRYESSLDLMETVTVFKCEYCGKETRLDTNDLPEWNYCERV